MNWWEKPVLSLDLETTGTDPHSCEVVQWAAARVAPNGRVLEAHTGVVRTEGWGEGAEAVHGITREESAHGMSVPWMLHSIENALRHPAPLVVFNAAYDLSILNRLGLEVQGRVLDPLVLDRGAEKYRRGSRKLGAMYAHYLGRAPDGAHDALADAVAAARLVFAMAERHEVLRQSAEFLHRLQVEWAAEQASSFQAYKRRTDPTAVIDGSWPVRAPGVVS